MTDNITRNQISYYRKRNNAFLDPFVSMKHIQKTNRVSSSQYTDAKGTHIGSQEIKNKKHGSYDRYLRKIKSPIIKSKGSKTGIIRGCKCESESEPELTYNTRTIDITYEGPSYNDLDYVYAKYDTNTFYEKAQIIQFNVNEGTYDISFNSNNETISGVNKDELEPYFGDCKCGRLKNGKLFISDPREITDCFNYDANKKEYFMQMGGYFKRVGCL